MLQNTPQKENFLHLVLATDKGFLIPTCTAISSVLLTNKNECFCFHIVHSGLEEKDKDLIQKTVKKFSPLCSLSFYDANKETKNEFAIRKDSHITLATFYRLILPSLLPKEIQKVLYLDGDVICTGYLKDFYDTDLEGFSLAGVHDAFQEEDESVFLRLGIPKENGYVCAGIILMNIEYWREHDIEKKTLDFVTLHKDICKFYDQDAMNHILSGKIKWVDSKYDVLSLQYANYTKDPKLLSKQEQEAIFSPVLLHFTGQRKPWHIECPHPLRAVWRCVYETTFGKKPQLIHKYKGKIRFLWSLKKILHLLGVKHYADYLLPHCYDELKQTLCSLYECEI